MRLAELIATFAVAADTAMGMPMDRGLRTAAVAARLAELAQAPLSQRCEAYYLALLRYAGCTADSELAAEVMGDELAVRGALYGVDWGAPAEFMPRLARAVGKGQGARAALQVARVFAKMPKLMNTAQSHCEVGDRLALALGFDESFRLALYQTFERWDGRGWPRKLRGDALALPVRIAHVAEDIEVGHRQGGAAGSGDLLGKRAGKGIDPSLCRMAMASLSEVTAPLSAASSWAECLAAEPAAARSLADAQLDDILRALGDFSDLKSRFTRGHARGVSALARAAAAQLGLDEAAQRTLERAAWVHDIGRVAVSTSVWDHAGTLNDAQWERVRMHTYVGERILMRVPALAELAELAMQAHERLDGSGYHRRLQAAQSPLLSRLLAAADVYHALTEARAHRPAFAADAAADMLSDMVKANLLCSQAVSAVLTVAGQPRRAAIERPCGLTERELEVLRLIARGLTNKEVASALTISTKTVSRHLEHVFQKLGVTTRAAATLYALQSGLLA